MQLQKGLKVLFKANSSRTNYVIYSTGQGVAIISGLLLIPLFTKKLPTEGFGVIGILWLIIPIVTRLMNLGLDVAISLKFFKLNHQDLSRYLYNALFTITTIGILVSILGLWQIYWVQKLIDPTFTRLAYGLLMVSIVGSIYRTMMASFLIKERKAVQNILMEISPPIVIALTTYILVTQVRADYISYITGMALGNGIFALISLTFFFANYSIKYFSFSIKIQRELLLIGLPTILGTLGAILLASGDRYVIKWFLGLEAVAIYTLGYRLAETINLGLLNPFKKVLNPNIYQKAASNLEEAVRYNHRNVLFIFSGVPLIIAAIVIPMNDIMDWLGGAVYNQAYNIFLIVLPGILLFVATQLSSFLLLHMERTDLIMLRTLLVAVMNIGLNIWLIPKYGIVAGVFTTIFSYLLMFILTIIFVNRFTVYKQSIAALLLRLGPFVVFLGGGFLIDNVVIPIWWQAYIIKIALWLGLVLGTWFFIPEFKATFSHLLPVYGIQNDKSGSSRSGI